MKTQSELLADALAIWHAGVDAVRSDRLVRENVQLSADTLTIVDHEFAIAEIDRIVVVGAGKAGAGMARGLVQALGSEFMAAKNLVGFINVPEDCVEACERITLHGARPAGVNEPTAAGVFGTERMLALVSQAGPRDLCLCLISGGGSALLPAPIEGVSLAEKQALTRFLSGAGANIRELNTVRKRLSRVKGGRLAQACRAGTLISLVISDVLGDPLDLIASGPTFPDPASPADALAVLARFDPQRTQVAQSIYAALERETNASIEPTCEVIHETIGNLAVAVDAAGIEAERRGYSHAMHIAREFEGTAEEVGEHLASMTLSMSRDGLPDCLITGGEPIVRLPPKDFRGRGGRNQQLVLSALRTLGLSDVPPGPFALLSGGTDGEDGPTNAAGAYITSETLADFATKRNAIEEALRRCDAYTYFDALGQLIRTGPTHTNVCDIRVMTIAR